MNLSSTLRLMASSSLRVLGVTILLLAMTLSGYAQISITTFGTPLTQDFNTLATTGSSSTLPAGWALLESGTGANTSYTAGTGSLATGDTYSFGTGTNTDRALGGLLSGSLVPSFGAFYMNNTGSTITQITITYIGEQWRLGATGRVDQIDFQYSLNATSLSTGTWTDVNTLDFIAPITAGTTGALDGNAAANRTLKTATIIGLSIPNGSTFWIRWTDFNATGSDDGLAVDDFSLTATLPPPNYTITTTGNAIVITDDTGNGETIAMTESGGNVRFIVTPTTRTYSINGGATTAFSTPADVSLAGVNIITVNAAAGHDNINVGAFAASLPSLTINGGTGDDVVNFNGDITFATNANLDVDLQNDHVTPGIDQVIVGFGDNLVLSGTGTATIKVSQRVEIDLNGSIVTENGNLLIEANQQAIPGSGNFVGVVNAGLIQASGTGSVTVLGKGGDTGANNSGIYVVNGTGIRTNGSGTVTVIGTGGASTGNSNYGIFINNVLNGIHSVGGDVNVTGQGGGSGSSISNFGVYLSAGSGITNAGAGNMSVSGTGGGMTTGGTNYGIFIDFDSGINHSGTGSLTVSGTGGNTSGGSNIGVFVAANNALISSAGGAVIVNGTGSNGAADIQTQSGGMIASTSTTAGITLNSSTNGSWPNSEDTDVSTTTLQSTSFGAGSKLNIDIDGITVNTQYSQLAVIGMINLNDAELSFAGSTHSPTGAETFTIVDNDDTDAVTGTFLGLPEGATIPNFLGSSLSASISYIGGDGNDVVISVIPNVICYADTDEDGFGDPDNSMTFSGSCGAGFITDNTDCDDDNEFINPNTVWYLDADDDGFSVGPGITQCESPGLGYKYTVMTGYNDCDDNNSTINPNASEICNGVDDDCDGLIDESGDEDNDGIPDCFDNCIFVANSTIRPISIDGNIADFGAPIGNDNGINYYFSADNDYFYIGVSGVNLGDDNIHIAFSNADGSTTATNWGVDFTNTPYTYLISFFGSNDICYYPYTTPYSCQQVGIGNWLNYAGFSGNTTSEIRIPRNFLGSLISGSGEVNLTIWANNNAGSFVFSTYPSDNPTGPANVLWSSFGQVQYPTYLPQVDADGDGYGAACDCDDNNDEINPGATEICDGLDNNCDTEIDEGFTLTTYYTDADGDGYGTGAGQLYCADPGAGYATQAGDCDDGNAAINPGAIEICDGIDNNCDGQTDEGLTFITYYTDADGDGYGVGAGTSLCADPGPGFATLGGDCDDGNAAINPGATEICDGVDNDCDGLSDEGLTFITYYTDADGDGFGTGAGQSLCANPGGGYATQSGDCDDGNAAINPAATEICDGIDNNCDGQTDEGLTFITYYTDADGDGYGVGVGTSLCADPGAGFATLGGDCDDGNAAINPGAIEICDGIDNNCDGQMDEGLTFVTYYTDLDGDGYGTGPGQSLCADPGMGFATLGGDCNDEDPSINPGATESCDGIDNDCDTDVDEEISFITYYPDGDGDGYGTGAGQSLCANPGVGFSTLGGDCDDADPSINPGATEICDGVDNNCDGQTDEGLTFITYYTDADGDGFGTGAGQSLCANPGAGFATQAGDCDDTNDEINPDAPEICDGVDNNCDGQTDEGLTFITYYTDADSDGYGVGAGQSLCANPGPGFATLGGDCDDVDPTINPGATEICDGVDNDCDGLSDEGLTFITYYTDADGDGYGTGAGQSLCANPGAGFATLAGDCNDSNPAINPAATEICDGIDNDCDGLTDEGLTFITYYTDADGDGYGVGVGTSLCADPGPGFATLGGDCNDSNPAINPAATEICDGIDNDCDGLTDEGLTFTTYYTDADGDGYGTGAGQSLCANPGPGFATLAGDCNDSNPAINPAATEICDGIDNDCDGLTDEGLTFITYYTDADSDGFGTGAGQSLCTNPGAGFATLAGDCNDSNPAINPAATEICDSIDNDCDGLTDEGLTFTTYYTDADGDGYGTGVGASLCANPGAGFATLAGDCNDSNPAINPAATEICDGIDNDCDGLTDEGLTFTTYYTDADGDGYGTGAGQSLCANPGPGFATQAGDCDDGNPTVNPGSEEICGNDVDDNCNLQIDEECCDLLISNVSSTPPACPGGSTGTITISAGSSSGPINYVISGPVNQNNQSGLFTGLPAGFYSISLTDAAMCSESSSVSVGPGMDATPPTVMCFNQTINFNGESSIPLNSNELASYSDNCGIQSITLSPNSISSAQVGQTVPVLVTVTDNSGNTAICTSQITVNGLPPGWSQSPNGVGCTNGNYIEYNTATQIWTATSTNCYYASPYTSDQSAFAQRTLCGNGSITAEVTGINGTALGWAGIVMRESNAPGAKKVQLMTNLSNFLRREVRSVTNGPAIPQQFPSYNRYWLRLVRTGTQIVGYSSSNGINWFQVLIVNVPMNSCIEMGLVVTNYNQNSTVTATFENVSFTGNGPILPISNPDNGLIVAANIQPDFSVYPNPTSGELNIDLREYIGKNVQIELYSLEGKLMQLIRVEVLQNTETMLLDRYAGGMYFVKLKSAGLPDVTKRVVLTKG